MSVVQTGLQSPSTSLKALDGGTASRGREGRGGQEDALRVSTEGAEATGNDDDESRPEMPDEPPDGTVLPDSADETRTSEGRAEHVLSRAQRELEHTDGCTNSPDDEIGRAKVAADGPADPTGPGEGVKGAGGVDNDSRSPGKPHKPPDNPHDPARDPTHVHVGPGGGTYVERNGSVAPENADAGIDGEVVGACRDVQDVVERSKTRRGDAIEEERLSADDRRRELTKTISTTKRSSTTYLKVPQSLHHHANRQNEPSRAERKGLASSENELTSAKADALEASGCVEDAENWPKNLGNGSERVSNHYTKPQTARQSNK